MSTVKVKLHIGPVTREFAIKPELESDFRLAADRFTKKWLRYQQLSPDQAPEVYMAVTILDLTVQLVQLEREKDLSPYASSIKKLTEEISQVLNQK